MEPKPAAPSTTFGAPNGGVFVKLKTSVRNSRFMVSVKLMRLISATSRLRYAGPRTGLRELLPMVNCGAIVNGAVLKKRAVVCSDEERFGFATRFGRCVPKPANALKFVTWVTASGNPDCRVTTPASSRSFRIAPATPPGS